MHNAVIFGATANQERLKAIDKSYNVIFAVDNDKKKHGKILYNNIYIKDINALIENSAEYEYVVVASTIDQNEIFHQLADDFKIDETKIILNFVSFPLNARIQFLKSFSSIVYDKNILGAVCEVGVFRGEFAKEINSAFSDRQCYLFDTFEGFDARDTTKEKDSGYSQRDEGHLNFTSVDTVLQKMNYRNKVTIKKGYFPDTFDINDETFCFVNLDVDLYNPTLSGLKIFWPRISKGGVLLIHDYFHPSYTGVKVAVNEFADEKRLNFFAIGDGISVAFQKQ